MKTKEVIILFKDCFKTQFMQDADMFEKFKVVICPPAIATVNNNWSKKQIEDTVNVSKGQPYEVIAIFDNDKIYFKDESVKVVSDGKGWVTIDDYIKTAKMKVQ